MFLAAMLAMVPVAPPPCWHSRRPPWLLPRRCFTASHLAKLILAFHSRELSTLKSVSQPHSMGCAIFRL
jgi:hypothetical protein